MDLDAWYNKVWLGQEDSYVPGASYAMTKPTRGYHYQATTSSLPSYHNERQHRMTYKATGGRRSSPKRRASPTRAYPASAERYSPKKGPLYAPADRAMAGSFPVKDFEHIRNALSRARTAPTPEGMRTCACARAQSLGLKGHFPSCPMNN